MDEISVPQGLGCCGTSLVDNLMLRSEVGWLRILVLIHDMVLLASLCGDLQQAPEWVALSVREPVVVVQAPGWCGFWTPPRGGVWDMSYQEDNSWKTQDLLDRLYLSAVLGML